MENDNVDKRLSRLFREIDDLADELGLQPAQVTSDGKKLDQEELDKEKSFVDEKYELLRARLASEASAKINVQGKDPKVLRARLKMVFSNSLMRQYAPGVFQFFLGDEKTRELHASTHLRREAKRTRDQKKPDDEIAEQFGLESGANISRRRKPIAKYVFDTSSGLAHDKEALPLPSFKTIAHMNAAYNVEIERGAVIALNAHKEAVEYFATECDNTLEWKVTSREVMCLFLSLRSERCWQAITCDPSTEHRKVLEASAAAEITSKMRDEFPNSNLSFDEIRQIVHSLRHVWPFVWSTLPDGWFK